nr:ATP synthase subunit beta [Ipomoea batatas]
MVDGGGVGGRRPQQSGPEMGSASRGVGKMVFIMELINNVAKAHVAEHFRDAEGQDMLFSIDNIFRFTQVSYFQ